jgi:hypothetical protein
LTDISVHTLFAYLTSSLLHPLSSGTSSYSHVITSSEESPITSVSVEAQYRQTKAKRRKSAPREEVEMTSMDNER